MLGVKPNSHPTRSLAEKDLRSVPSREQCSLWALHAATHKGIARSAKIDTRGIAGHPAHFCAS